MAAGIAGAEVPGRLQRIGERPDVLIDVAHNPEAAAALAVWLDAHPRPTRAVFSALADKDIAGIVGAIGDRIGHWHLCGLDAETPRGLAADELARRIGAALPAAKCSVEATPVTALAAARAAAGEQERVLAFGSFYLVAALLRDGSTALEPNR